MADELNGISLSEKDILGALQGLFSNGGTTTKTFEVKTKGFKEVAKEAKEATRGLQGFGKALEEITSGKASDSYINKLNEITNLIADKNGKFRKVNVQSFTSELSKALVDPTTSAQKLSKIIDDVYDNLMALSQVSNSKNFNFFNETQLKNIIEMQKKQNQLKNKLDIEQGNRRTEAMNMYRDVDILTASRVKNIDKVRHTEIADSLGIDKSNIDLSNGDDALLSDYKQVADLLAKMISDRKEFNKLNSKNVGDYVQQEQDLLNVFRQLQSIENKVQDQFDIDPSKLLSNQFQNKNGQFDFYSNVNKAVREYTNVMTSSVSKELQQAVNRQKEFVLKASSKQVQRAESNISSIQRGRFKPNADVVNNGEEIGDSVAHGMHQAEEAIDSANEEIKQYIVSVDESIDKIHDLFDQIDAINEQIDSGLSGKKEDEAYDNLDKKYAEIAKYRANLERQGFSQQDFDDEFTKEMRKEIDIQVKALQNSDLEQQISDIKSFVESKPIEIPITTEADKKTDEVIRETSDKVNILSDDISNRTKITIFDGVSEQVFDVEKDIDSLIEKLDEMAQKMQTPVFHAGNLNPSALNDSNYRPADSLQFVTERHMGSSMGTGTYFGSNMADIIDTFRNKNKNGQNTELYAADLAKYQNSLLQFSGDEEQEAFGEFLKKVTAFIMSIATEDEKFRAQIKGIEPGDTESLFNELKSWFDIFNVNIHSLQEFVDEEVQYIKGFTSTSDMAQSKSIGTRFQEKFIGNKGIDATRGALNDSYAMGSVIFDIDKSHPFDISFGNNEDIATYFYQKVIERILSKKAANPENYVDDIVNEYLTNSNLKQITSMTSDIQPRLEAIHETHKNDLPESIETLNASLLKQKTTQPSNIEIDTSSASQTINELKNEIESLKEQLQKFKDMDATPEGFEQLQEKLKQTEQRADSLSQELSSVYEHSVPDSDYRNLEESLSQAKDEAIELREELEKIEKEKQDDNIGIIQNSSQISSEETHIDTLYDELIKLRDLKKELAGIDLSSEDGVDQGYSLMYQIHELEDKLHELYSYNKDHHIIDAESTIDDISRIENKLMHGTILTMFRGTDNPDNPILSKGEHSGGTFFTDDIDSAKYYGENGKLYQAKLMIKDALEFIPDVNSMVDAVTFTGNGTDDVSARLKAAIDFVEQSGHSLYDFRNILMERYDEFRDGNDFVIPFDSLDEQLKNALMTIKTISEDTNNIYGVYRTTDTFAEKARTNGYDSLIIHDISEAFNQIGEEIKSTIAVIFDKNQLLSHIEIKPDETPVSSESFTSSLQQEDASSIEQVAQAHREAADAAIEHAQNAREAINVETEQPPVDISSAQSSAEADEQAAKAARDRAQANEELAESEAHVDQAESAKRNDTQKKMPEEFSSLTGVQEQVQAITTAVEAKTQAFRDEQSAVVGAAQAEVNALSEVEGAVDGITNAVQNKNKAVNAKPSDRNTTNNQNNQRNTSAGKDNSEDKTIKKTDEQIRDERDAATLKQYDTVLKEYLDLEQQRVNLAKQGNAQLSGEQELRRLSYIEKLNDIQDKWNSTQEHSNKLWDEFNKKVSNRDNRQQKLDTDLVSNYNAWAKSQTHYGNRLSSISTLKNERALRPEAFTNALDDLEAKGKELQSLFPLEPTDESGLRRAHELSDEIQQMSKEIRSNPEYKNARDTAIASLNKRAEQWASNNSAAIKADPEGFEQVRQAIKDINTLSDQNAASKMLDDFIAKSNQAGKSGLSFADTVKQRFKSLGAYLASFASFYDIIRYGREAIQTVTELDTAMTELKKVSDESEQSYSNFLKNSFDMADEVGTTSEQIIQSTADWSRLGEDFKTAQKSAEQSTLLMNVSEFENINDATDALVSMSQAYKEIEKSSIIDKLNNIGKSKVA